MKHFAILSSLVATIVSVSAQAAPSPHDPLPRRLLSCGGSVIRSIGGRLEGDTDFSSGTSVSLRNGGYGVSYEKVQAIVDSRVGDHVLVCLVFVPSNCPPGDDRGKVYTMTNLRTLESWTLPDAQHSCGGA